jgi:hypothetical protein
VAADGAVETPAAKLLTAAGKSNDDSAGALFDGGQQGRQAVAQSASTRRVVATPIGRGGLNQYGHTIGVPAGDLVHQRLVGSDLFDDCEDVTHGRESQAERLNRA